ncbi:MAG TPA: preQ(1) synthase [Kiritimatiellia bacterium]|nr:preQ(1) synthase [Kiritimatiellia bacterium]
MTKPRKSKPGSLTLLHQNDKNYPKKPSGDILEVFPNRFPQRDYVITFDCPEFTSVCPVTGQPDFGKIVIEYVPDAHCIESKSLKLYLGAYRNQGAFAEQIVNQVLTDCAGAVAPRSMLVTGHFTARGGISIKVEAGYSSDENDDIPF